MKLIQVEVSIGLVGCKQRSEFAVEDDESPEAIEAQAKQVAMEFVEWTYKVVARS